MVVVERPYGKHYNLIHTILKDSKYCPKCVNKNDNIFCPNCVKEISEDKGECLPTFFKEKTMEQNNNVVHPQHYNRENSIECIDEMIAVFGRKVVADFCLCNVWKYRYRAADKNGAEDLAKSDWYMQKYLEITEYLSNTKSCGQD